MEIHRLKPMNEDYDREIFNLIYQEVEPLKKALSNQIDHRRLGISQDVLHSWFDDKMLFVYNKHFQEMDPDVLKGYIINSLQRFKYRILRKAYTGEAEYFSSLVELEGEEKSYLNIIADPQEESDHEVFMGIVNGFMKDKLSREAYELYSLQLNPPPYILSRLKKASSRIPTSLLLEYYGYPDEKGNHFKKLKREINKTIKMAKKELTDLAISN